MHSYPLNDSPFACSANIYTYAKHKYECTPTVSKSVTSTDLTLLFTHTQAARICTDVKKTNTNDKTE